MLINDQGKNETFAARCLARLPDSFEVLVLFLGSTARSLHGLNQNGGFLSYSQNVHVRLTENHVYSDVEPNKI